LKIEQRSKREERGSEENMEGKRETLFLREKDPLALTR